MFYLIYLKHIEWDTATGDLLSNLNQMFLNVLHDGVATLIWKNLTNHVTRQKRKQKCKSQAYRLYLFYEESVNISILEYHFSKMSHLD